MFLDKIELYFRIMLNKSLEFCHRENKAFIKPWSVKETSTVEVVKDKDDKEPGRNSRHGG